MKDILIRTVLVMAMLALLQAVTKAEVASSPSPSSAVNSGEDKAITDRATTAFFDLRKAKVDRAAFEPKVAKILTDSMVASVAKTLRNLGTIEKIEFVQIQKTQDGLDSSLYFIRGSKGTMHYAFGLDKEGKIAIFAFE